MKKHGLVIITTVALVLLGVIIIWWSIHQKTAQEPQNDNVKVFTDDNFQAEVVGEIEVMANISGFLC